MAHGKYSRSDHLLLGHSILLATMTLTAWHVYSAVYRHVAPCLPPPCRPWAEAALTVTQDTDPSPAQPSPAQPAQCKVEMGQLEQRTKQRCRYSANTVQNSANTVQTVRTQRLSPRTECSPPQRQHHKAKAVAVEDIPP